MGRVACACVRTHLSVCARLSLSLSLARSLALSVCSFQDMDFMTTSTPGACQSRAAPDIGRAAPHIGGRFLAGARGRRAPRATGAIRCKLGMRTLHLLLLGRLARRRAEAAWRAHVGQARSGAQRAVRDFGRSVGVLAESKSDAVPRGRWGRAGACGVLERGVRLVRDEGRGVSD
jgi:hypothetical protein